MVLEFFIQILVRAV